MSFLRTTFRTRSLAYPLKQASLTPHTFPTLRTFATDSTPPSESSQEQKTKQSRATDDPKTTELGGSVSRPVSGKGDVAGQSEEGGDPVKQDKELSAEEKRKRVEGQQKPLDAADK